MITFSELQPTGNVSKFLSNFRTDCGGVNATINGSYFSGPIIISNNPTLNFSSLNIYNNTLDMSILNSKINANINFTLRNLTLDTDSELNATGKGYSGNELVRTDSGPGASLVNDSGAGYGGKGGNTTGGPSYGNPLEPKDLGSGGIGSTAAGGSGGGFVYLNTSNKFEANGIILSNSLENAGGGGGSGGSILVYTYNLTGSGNFTALGGATTASGASGGAGGRIAIYYNFSDMSFSKSNVTGGKSADSRPRADPGTFIAIDLEKNTATIVEAFEFNSSYFVNNSKFKPFANSSYTFENITFKGGDELRIMGNVSFNITNLNWSTTKINVSNVLLEIIYGASFNDTLTTYSPIRNSSFNLSIEKRAVGRIDFLSNLSYTMNISAAINLSTNFIKVNTTLNPILNVTSKLTFYNLTGANLIPIFDLNDRDSYQLCRLDRCTNNNFNVNQFSMNVTSFTTYSGINDSIIPLVDYYFPTEPNNSFVNQDWILVNASVTEAQTDNITFRLLNTTSTINTTMFFMFNDSSNITINFTSLTTETATPLSEGEYYYNFTVVDMANNTNTTRLRTITLDRTFPKIDFIDTPADGSSISDTFFSLSVNITETNPTNITFHLMDNAFASINASNYTMSNSTSNTSTRFTGLTLGATYRYNVTITDKANNRNTTTRSIVVSSPSSGDSGSSSGGGDGAAGENIAAEESPKPPIQEEAEKAPEKKEEAGIIKTPEGEIVFEVGRTGGVFKLDINSTQGSAELGLTFINASYGINVPKLDIKLKHEGKLRLKPSIDIKLPALDPLSFLLLLILLTTILIYAYYKHKRKEYIHNVPPHLRYVPMPKPIR